MSPIQDHHEAGEISAAPHPLRIVYLDDEVTLHKVLSLTLTFQFATLEITSCRNGDEAWQALQAAPPDLFISDQRHEGLSTVELSHRLAKLNPQIPMLVLSAFLRSTNFHEEMGDATHPGLRREFLAKPPDLRDLRQTIARLITVPTTPPPATGPDIRPVQVAAMIANPGQPNSIPAMLRQSLVRYTLQQFYDDTWAVQRLAVYSPELFIADLDYPEDLLCDDPRAIGGNLLKQLAKQRVKFPILVSSKLCASSDYQAQMRTCAGSDLHTCFLTKPFTIESFQTALCTCLGAERLMSHRTLL